MKKKYKESPMKKDFAFEWDVKVKLLPGKEFLSSLNEYLQDQYKITIT